MFNGERKQATKEFSFSFWTWMRFLGIQLQEISYTFDKLVGITTMKIETLRTHFLSDSFPAVAVLASYSYRLSLMF